MPMTGLAMRTYTLGGHRIELYVSESLFTPNPVTVRFSRGTEIVEGDVVFDVGAGIGPLTVYAALEPSSKVYSVEVVEEQVELAKVNVEHNGMTDKVEIYHGSYFDPIPEGVQADVVIGDISGISDRVANIMGWYPPLVPTGGNDGSELLVELLRRAPPYLKEGGRLYFGVSSLSNGDRIMEEARKHFVDVRSALDIRFPVSKSEYEQLMACPDEMSISVFERGKRYIWKGQVMRATKPRG